MRSVHATADERSRTLPGDEFIANAGGSLTHAATLSGPPAAVWPWLVQMGAGRAGWYSYDRIDNGGRPSAWVIRPELQSPPIGTIFPALPGRGDGFRLVALEPKRHLVLAFPHADGRPLTTWSFVLHPVGASATRLVVRARGERGYRSFGLPSWLSRVLIKGVHFVMERRQLLGLAARVEQTDPHRDAYLDRLMPEYDVVEQHSIRVAAPPEVTFEAACRIDLQDSAVVRAIIRGRELMLGSRHEPRPRSQGLVADTKAMGWGVLAEAPGREIVMGAVTRPWEPDVTFRALPPEAFAAFREPGFVKIAWTLRADPDGAGSIFRTETRVQATDADARRRFRRYWRRVWPGIVLIRLAALRLVRGRTSFPQ
jgi:hypothetical protein